MRRPHPDSNAPRAHLSWLARACTRSAAGAALSFCVDSGLRMRTRLLLGTCHGAPLPCPTGVTPMRRYTSADSVVVSMVLRSRASRNRTGRGLMRATGGRYGEPPFPLHSHMYTLPGQDNVRVMWDGTVW